MRLIRSPTRAYRKTELQSKIAASVGRRDLGSSPEHSSTGTVKLDEIPYRSNRKPGRLGASAACVR